MRFVGGQVYCPRTQARHFYGLDHRYGTEFVCLGCGVRIPETAYRARSRA